MAQQNYMLKCVLLLNADIIVLRLHNQNFKKSRAMGEKWQFTENCNFQHQIMTSFNHESKSRAAPILY